MNDFISDDHEHSLSIVALTVQIFTVPTIVIWICKIFLSEFGYVYIICI